MNPNLTKTCPNLQRQPPERALLRILLVGERVGEAKGGRGQDLLGVHLPLRGPRVWSKQGEQGGQEEQTVHQAEHDHQEDDFGKCPRDVAGNKHKGYDAKHGGEGALKNWGSYSVKAISEADAGRYVGWGGKVVVGDVCGGVDAEPDSHNEHNHGDHVQVHSPVGHESDHANFNGDYSEDYPEHRDPVGDEDEGDDSHGEYTEEDSLEGAGGDVEELVKEREVRIEDDSFEGCTISDLPHHGNCFFLLCRS